MKEKIQEERLKARGEEAVCICTATELPDKSNTNKLFNQFYILDNLLQKPILVESSLPLNQLNLKLGLKTVWLYLHH